MAAAAKVGGLKSTFEKVVTLDGWLLYGFLAWGLGAAVTGGASGFFQCVTGMFSNFYGPLLTSPENVLVGAQTLISGTAGAVGAGATAIAPVFS